MNWTSSKLRTSALWKTPLRELKDKIGKKYLQTIYLTENLYPEVIYISQNSVIRKQSNNKLVKDLVFHIEMTNKYMIICLTHQSLGKCKLKAQWGTTTCLLD